MWVRVEERREVQIVFSHYMTRLQVSNNTVAQSPFFFGQVRTTSFKHIFLMHHWLHRKSIHSACICHEGMSLLPLDKTDMIKFTFCFTTFKCWEDLSRADRRRGIHCFALQKYLTLQHQHKGAWRICCCHADLGNVPEVSQLWLLSAFPPHLWLSAVLVVSRTDLQVWVWTECSMLHEEILLRQVHSAAWIQGEWWDDNSERSMCLRVRGGRSKNEHLWR